VFTLISWAPGKEEADLNRQRGLNMLREYLAIGQEA